MDLAGSEVPLALSGSRPWPTPSPFARLWCKQRALETLRTSSFREGLQGLQPRFDWVRSIHSTWTGPGTTPRQPSLGATGHYFSSRDHSATMRPDWKFPGRIDRIDRSSARPIKGGRRGRGSTPRPSLCHAGWLTSRTVKTTMHTMGSESPVQDSPPGALTSVHWPHALVTSGSPGCLQLLYSRRFRSIAIDSTARSTTHSRPRLALHVHRDGASSSRCNSSGSPPADAPTHAADLGRSRPICPLCLRQTNPATDSNDRSGLHRLLRPLPPRRVH